MSLASLQKQLTDAIFQRHLLDENLSIGGGEECFALYRNNIFVSLIKVLRGLYPLTAKNIGDDFSSLARDYIAMHPPAEPHLMHYGSDFPDFIGSFNSLGQQIAAVEKLCNLSYAAPASDILTAEKLMSYDEEVRLNLPIGLAESCFVSAELPDTLAQDICQDNITRADFDDENTSYILVSRPFDNVVKKIISPASANFLNTIEQENFNSALNQFMENEASATQILAEFFTDRIFILP